MANISWKDQRFRTGLHLDEVALLVDIPEAWLNDIEEHRVVCPQRLQELLHTFYQIYPVLSALSPQFLTCAFHHPNTLIAPLYSLCSTCLGTHPAVLPVTPDNLQDLSWHPEWRLIFRHSSSQRENQIESEAFTQHG